MPEKPEVMTVAKTLDKIIVGKRIKSVDVLWDNIIVGEIKEFKKKIKNQKVEKITTRGKFIVIFLTSYALLIHLRMEGKFFFRKKGDEINKHEHVIFRFDDNSEMRYHDVRKFGKIQLVDKLKLYDIAPLNKLGYDYYDKDLTESYLKEAYKKINKPIKSVLLDQSIIAGIGNIYADEILFRSKLNPYLEAKRLSIKDCTNIVKYTKEILDAAEKKGGTTIKSFTSSEGVHGLFQNELSVHGQKVCPICNNTLIKEFIGGRGTYYCKKCQKKKN